MAYTQTTWNPGGPPGVSAPALQKLEKGVYDAHVTADAAVKRAGDNMTGSLAITAPNTGIELGSTSTANTPFIDFHSSGNNHDYDARIIGSGGNGSPAQGTINFDAVALQWKGITMAQTRTINGYVEWNNGGTWQGLGGIKGVQRGISGTADTTITISAVNMSKSFVTFNNFGSMHSSSPAPYRAYLNSSTQLVIGAAGGSTGNGNLAWEVVEFF